MRSQRGHGASKGVVSERMEQRSVERKVHFVKVACDKDFTRVLRAVHGLSGAAMYSFTRDRGGGIFMKSLEELGDMVLGSIGKLRMNDLPSVGKNGDRDVQKLNIAEDEGLVELTYFIYFKDSGILAIEYNHRGPLTSTLEWHLISRHNEINGEPLGLEFQQIFDEETMQKLSDHSEVRLMRMVVPKDKIGNLAKFDPSIHAAFENAAHFGNTGSVEVILRFAKRKKDAPPSGDELIDKLQGIEGIPDDTFSKFRLRVKPSVDDRVQDLDLLQNRLTVTLNVPLQGRDREISPSVIFGLIKEAYQEKRRVLARLVEYESFDRA